MNLRTVQDNISFNALRAGIVGAIISIVGILFSGPVGLVLVTVVKPQPPWRDAAIFSQNFHFVQTAPFFFGFALIAGYLIMMASAYRIAEIRHKVGALGASLLTASFTALIFFNYICQTTFVPALALHYEPAYDPIIATFSFSNPLSLCWAIEMWGYALLGGATWLIAPIFNRNRLEKALASLLVLNGILSIAGGFATSINLGWVMTMPGMISYIAWNCVVLSISILFVLTFKRRVQLQSAGKGQTNE
jgi:hypothetical protein